MYEILTDKELMSQYYDAIEMRDGKLINELKQEMNKRNSD